MRKTLATAAALIGLLLAPAAAHAGKASLEQHGSYFRFVAGAGERNDLRATWEQGRLTVTDAGAPLQVDDGCDGPPGGPRGCTGGYATDCERSADGHRLVCPAARAPYATVELGDADDAAVVDLPVRDPDTRGEGPRIELHGGDGADRLEGGPNQDDFFYGGAGPDVFVAGGGKFNWVTYTDKTAPVTVTFDGLANDGVEGEGDLITDGLRVQGGSGDDRLVGNDKLNMLSGGPGNDFMKGGGGWDYLVGGEGDDWIDVRDGPGEGFTSPPYDPTEIPWPPAVDDYAFCSGGTDTLVADHPDADPDRCEVVHRDPPAPIAVSSRGGALLRVACDDGEVCQGALTLEPVAGPRARTSAAPARFVSAAFSVAGQSMEGVQVRLSRPARRYLRRRAHIPARLVLERGGAGGFLPRAEYRVELRVKAWARR